MAVVTMYRGEQKATVDTDFVETYENFLDHGWKLSKDAEPEEAPVPAKPVNPTTPPAAPRGRKAR